MRMRRILAAVMATAALAGLGLTGAATAAAAPNTAVTGSLTPGECTDAAWKGRRNVLSGRHEGRADGRLTPLDHTRAGAPRPRAAGRPRTSTPHHHGDTAYASRPAHGRTGHASQIAAAVRSSA